MSDIFNRLSNKSRTEWLEQRIKGIGGSDVSSIIGMNPYKSNVDLYREKLGLVNVKDISNLRAVKFGIDCEPYLRGMFIAEYGDYFNLYHNDHEILQNVEYPFMLASLDGEVIATDDIDLPTYKSVENPLKIKKGMKGILECKTTTVLNSISKEKWNETIPDNYFTQCCYYLFVTGYDFVIVPALLRFDYKGEITYAIRFYGFMADEVLDDIKYVAIQTINFWNNNIVPEKEPNLIIGIR